MDEIDRLRSLDRPDKEPPRVDVADRVLADIRSCPPARLDPLLPVLATLGSSAALTAWWLAYEAWSVLFDPLGCFLDFWSPVLR
jgi:hypothetical protein